jgi:hypothetical protein
VVLLSAQSQAPGSGGALSELYRKLEPVDALTPEKVFAARWAMALLGEAMNRLRQEYASGHNVAAFDTLKAFLEVGKGKEPPTYEQAAAALQVSVGAVKTLIHRLRKQYTASGARRLAARSQPLLRSTPRFTNFAKL